MMWENKKIDRRSFLKIAGLAATSAALGCATKNSVPPATPETKKTTDASQQEPSAESTPPRSAERAPTIAERFSFLQQKHPELKTHPDQLLTAAVTDYYTFLAECTDIQQLVDLKIISPEGAKYLYSWIDNKTRWQALNKQKTDPVAWKKLGEKILAAPTENITWETLCAHTQQEIATCRTVLTSQRFPQNNFTQLLNAPMLLAIFIQEVAPRKITTHKLPLEYGARQRIEFFRLLLNADWEVTHTPARDPHLSYGLPQTTAPTHQNLFRLYRQTNLITAPFAEQHTLAAQIRSAYLLAYDNLLAFTKLTKDSKKFLTSWRLAPEKEQRRFLASLLGSAHNFGNNAAWRQAITAVLHPARLNLETYRQELLRAAETKLTAVAGRHAANSGLLYAHLENMLA